MYNLVKSLKKNRVPIHGIGVQGHLIVGSVPTTIEENLRKFATLGVEVAITELDIRMELPATKEKLEQQRKDYMTVIGACKAVPACIGVTIWDWTDKVGIHDSWILRAVFVNKFLKYTWVPDVFPGEGSPLPWDEEYNRKPAFLGILEGFLIPSPHH